MRNKIMTIGGATYDIFLHENMYPSKEYTDASGVQFLLIPQGRKVEFGRVHYATGGGATNVAVGLKRQGLDVTTFCIIGDDSQGRFIVDELVAEQVAVDCVVKLPGCSTGTSVVLPASSGEGSLLVCHGASNTMQESHIPFSVIAQQQYLYIAPLPAAELLPVIVNYARTTEISYIAINPGTNQLYFHPEYLYETFARVDCLILNEIEARQLFNWLVNIKKIPLVTSLVCREILMEQAELGQSKPGLIQAFGCFGGIDYSLAQYMFLIHSLGPSTVVVTAGAQGVYVGFGSKIFFHASIEAPICNTVGAGDAFGAAFMASISSGRTIEQAMVRGICNSSSVLQGVDAKSGLLSSDALDRAVQDQKMSEVQIFMY